MSAMGFTNSYGFLCRPKPLAMLGVSLPALTPLRPHGLNGGFSFVLCRLRPMLQLDGEFKLASPRAFSYHLGPGGPANGVQS